jgi:molybdate transport system substrate-binding protein
MLRILGGTRIGRRLAVAAIGLAVWSAGFGSAGRAEAADTVVFAAASLKNALDELVVEWKGQGGGGVVVSYAASSALAKQIEQAAPADLFISADLDWMTYLAERNLIRPDTRVNLLGNSIVLVATGGTGKTAEIGKDFPLAEMLGDGRLAMGDPKAVPAGKYGKAALESLSVWSSVEGKLAPAENVRAALALVARGEAPLGIVYKTDAAIEPGVEVIGTFPADSHPPIIYPMAVTASSTNPDAVAFAAFLRSDKARATFEKAGFTVMAPPAAS